MRKRLQYLVIHCTATPRGRAVSADDIRRWHTRPVSLGGRGWKQVGYSAMIHLDGRLERLVEHDEDEWVDPWEITNGARGVNAVSRHIVYVGGCSSDGQRSEDTRTPEQRATLEQYVRAFHARHPEVRIIGHNEIARKDCPSFDVQAWLKSLGITNP